MCAGGGDIKNVHGRGRYKNVHAGYNYVLKGNDEDVRTLKFKILKFKSPTPDIWAVIVQFPYAFITCDNRSYAKKGEML